MSGIGSMRQSIFFSFRSTFTKNVISVRAFVKKGYFSRRRKKTKDNMHTYIDIYLSSQTCICRYIYVCVFFSFFFVASNIK